MLVVVSSFKPAMLADMQRARMLGFCLGRYGWDVEILTPAAKDIRQDALDPDGNAFFPTGLQINEARAALRPFFRMLGARSSVWPTLIPLYLLGRQLLLTKRFDLVYFSTTAFPYFFLGSIWKKAYGIPYALDFHDPWVKPDSSPSPTVKGRLTTWVSSLLERRAVTAADGIVAVSPKYLLDLVERYGTAKPPWIRNQNSAAIPIGAMAVDLAQVRGINPPDSLRLQLCYVGAGGPIMARAFRLICRTLADLRLEGHHLASRVQLRLYGTTFGWKAGQPKTLETIAAECGVGDLVQEYPERVSYRRALEILMSSHGAIVLGVDDPGYIPSKLFGYALSGKPLLTCFHKQGPAFALMESHPELGNSLWFEGSEYMPDSDARAELGKFLADASRGGTFDRSAILSPFLAPAMAKRHAELFNRIVTKPE